MSGTTAITLDQYSGKTKSKVREYAESILWALALALVIRYCLIQTYQIPSGSMENTLVVGDRFIANKCIYGIRIPFTTTRVLKLRNPRRGDVIVFEYPLDRSKDFIKRVIGVPGDSIQVKDKQVYVNGVLYRNPHEIHKDAAFIPASSGERDNFGPVTVPANAYFVMGDNRDNSYDSRFWGFVRESDIRGKALIKFWSWDSEAWRIRWDNIGKVIV